jgi:hypothetical protein
MEKKYILAAVLLFVIIAAPIIIYKSQSIKRTYQAEAIKGLNRFDASNTSIVTGKDTEHLPKAVQNYLAYVGVTGKEKPQNARISLEGEMKLSPQKAWNKIKSEQYDFFDSPTRLYHIKGIINGIPSEGLDSYRNGKGNMLIKIASLFTVADARGREMDQSAAVTLLNDMCLLAPAALIDDRIQWKAIDPLTAEATFKDNGNHVSAILHFNEKGELTNFITDDRYYTMTDGSYQKVRWSTPVGNYKDFNGLRLPGYGEAIWHLPEGDFCYAKFNVKTVKFNCKTFQ